MDFKKGDSVHYIPFEGCDESLIENGVVKREGNTKDTFFVVYNCNGEWHNYEQYTAALTNAFQLRPGWHNK